MKANEGLVSSGRTKLEKILGENEFLKVLYQFTSYSEGEQKYGFIISEMEI